MRRPQERKRRHASKKDMEDSRYRLYRSTMPRLTPKMSAAAGPVHEIRAPPAVRETLSVAQAGANLSRWVSDILPVKDGGLLRGDT